MSNVLIETVIVHLPYPLINSRCLKISVYRANYRVPELFCHLNLYVRQTHQDRGWYIFAWTASHWSPSVRTPIVTTHLHLPLETSFITVPTNEAAEYWDSFETANSCGGIMNQNGVHTKKWNAPGAVKSAHSKYLPSISPVSHPSLETIPVRRHKYLHLRLNGSQSYVLVACKVKLSSIKILRHNIHPFRIPLTADALTKANMPWPLPFSAHKGTPPFFWVRGLG